MLTKKQHGYSLIELLIVVAIIGILAAIAVPNYLSSRRAANEGSAQSSLRTIHSCEATYYATVGLGEYADLTTLAGNTLTDSILGSGIKSGYTFEIHPTDSGVRPAQFHTTAVPITTGGPAKSGTRRFGLTEDGVMRGDSLSLAPYADHVEVRAAPPLSN